MLKELKDRAWLLIKNSRKPIGGFVAFAVTYAVTKAGLDIDPTVSAGIGATVAAWVVRKLRPIFGEPSVGTPEITATGRVKTNHGPDKP